jgi:hypothetical protein
VSIPSCRSPRRALVFLLAFSLVSSLQAQTPYLKISAAPPPDLPSRSAPLEDVAKFAWQEFLALNWKASVDSTHPPSPANPRGTADGKWNYSMATPVYPNPVVWQTYAQTTELRPNAPLTTPWNGLTYPKYSYQVPIAQGAPGFSNTLWNNLDEDSEIGSCDIYAHYANQTPPQNLVLFQVKVNKDEYEYVRTAFGATQNLPVVPSSGKVPPCPSNALLCNTQAKVAKNIINPPYAYYPGATSTCNCPPGQAVCLPCGFLPPPTTGLAPVTGAIEVKTAWRMLTPQDNPAHFFTATAIYYNVNAIGKLAYYNGTFGLVGMHIIHKTTNFPDFVFATFEQVGVEGSGSDYVLLSGAGVQTGPFVPIVRQVGQTNRTQMHPVPPLLDQVTAKVRAQIVGLNKSTIWQYYRLTGVQGASTDCPVTLPPGTTPNTQNCINYQTATQCTAPTLNPNYYMANFMVESDPLLNNFSGPGFANASIFTVPGGKPSTCQNTVYANKIYDNGGCKGCHGAAQTNIGTDFSFLLDFGNNKPSITPATIRYIVPPTQLTATASKALVRPLKHYLDKVKGK